MSILSQANRTKRVALDALLIAFAMMLSYLEVLLPISTLIPLPGFRLGLANLAVVLVFFLMSPVDAAIVSFVRILLMGLLFGNATSLYFSAMGGLFAFAVLLLSAKAFHKLSFFGISVLSAAMHNFGQICAAMTLFGVSLVHSYLPLLLLASTVYGGIVGALLNYAYPKIKGALQK